MSRNTSSGRAQAAARRPGSHTTDHTGRPPKATSRIERPTLPGLTSPRSHELHPGGKEADNTPSHGHNAQSVRDETFARSRLVERIGASAKSHKHRR